MFTFPIMAVRKVIARGEADAAANGGFRNTYCGLKSDQGEKPGVWLVGDEGISSFRTASSPMDKRRSPPRI